MQKETKNIDKLFHNASKDFEKEPPLYAWDKLENALDKKDKKRNLYFIYKIAASIVIIFSISITAYFFFQTHNSNENNKITYSTPQKLQEKNSNLPETSDTSVKKESNKVNTYKPSKSNNTEEKKSDIHIRKRIKNNNVIEKTPIINNYTEDNKYNIAVEQDTNIINKNSSYIASNQNQDSLIKIENNISPENKTELAQKTDDNVNKTNADTFAQSPAPVVKIEPDKIDNPIIAENKNAGNWSVKGQYAPAYSYRNISKTTNTIVNYKDNPIYAYSGGVNVGYYNIQERLGVETGVIYSYSGMENTNTKIYVDKKSLITYGSYYNAGIPSPESIVFINPNPLFHIETSSGNIPFNQDNFSFVDIASNQNSSQDDDYFIYPVNYSIVQKFEFIEIPLIVKYKIINRKIGVNILGGISTAYLVGNNSFVEKNHKQYNIGKPLNIEKFIYHGILGIGLQYAIYKQFSMNIEPNIKYALKPINKSYSIKYYPYSLSLSMGVSYDFK